MDRRHFLKRGYEASIATGLLAPLLGQAQTLERDHFFVLLRATGGWDVTLGLDPWTAEVLPDPLDMFLEYAPADLLTTPSGIRLGPAMAPLKSNFADICVVNGIFMGSQDNGHDASSVYMETGNGQGGASSVPVELALASGQTWPLGTLANYGLHLGSGGGATSNIQDVLALMDQGSIINNMGPLYPDLDRSTDFMRAIRNILASQTSMDNMYEYIQGFSGLGGELKSHYAIAASFLAGTSASAALSLDDANLDTHGGHEQEHLREQSKVWTQVNDIFTFFKSIEYKAGESLFDRTTFLVVSEFSRTPALNPARGKDHNPNTNSCLLAGKGVPPGLSMGASKLIPRNLAPYGRSVHIAYPINYKTGQVTYGRTPESRMIFPENLMVTLALMLKLDLAKFASVPKSTQPLKPLLA